MSENVQEKKSSSKLVVVLLIVVIVLLAGGIITAIVLLGGNNKDDISSADGEETAFTIGYENNGVVALSEDDFQRMMEEMVRQAEEGMIDLNYKNMAASEDGVNFACKIGNPISNRYDMYLNIYLNHDIEQQVLLTGLIAPGSEIDSFESEIPLEPGTYESTLVFTQVEDDHATICGQSMVVLTLVVSAEYDFDESAFD